MLKPKSFMLMGVMSALLYQSTNAVANNNIESEIDLTHLIPAEQLAEDLGQDLTNGELVDENNLQPKRGFHHHWPRFYPRHYPYPYYYPVPPPPPVITYPVGYQGVVCYASDQLGTTFSIFGYYVAQVQQEAMNQCFMYSNRGCYPRGCYYRY